MIPNLEPKKSAAGLSRRHLLGAAAVTVAAPSVVSAQEATLWKLWVRYVTGGHRYRPSYTAMFLDPMFLDMEIIPYDLPYNLALGGPPAAGPSNRAGLPVTGNNAPILPQDNPYDLPWLPSTSATTGVRSLMPGGAPIFSVLVMNDQTDWPDAARENARKDLDAGKGFVMIHNSLGDNQAWPWWYQEASGGLLVLSDRDGMKKSVVTGSAGMEVRPVGNHPIVQDISPFRLSGEECYKGMWQSPKITPLLEATGSATDRIVAWIGPNPNARVVCIQPGAASETHRNPAFRKLVRNAILWAGGRLE